MSDNRGRRPNVPPEQYKKYVPQHKIWGVEPIPYPSNTRAHMEPPNPRLRPKFGAPVESVNTQMIDNNDYVSENAFYQAIPVSEGFVNQTQFVDNPAQDRVVIDDFNNSQMPQQIFQKEEMMELSDWSQLNADDYILIVHGKVLYYGSKEEIEHQAKLLVFGDHELCEGTPVDVGNIVILKNVAIKLGLFID